jgi:hypothetical protein
MLFNIQHAENDFIEVKLTDVKFERIYARNKMSSESNSPLIINTEPSSKRYKAIINVTLINVEIVNVTNSQGQYLFYLLARDTKIFGMKTKNVGSLFSIFKKYNFFEKLKEVSILNQTKGIIYFPFA